MENIQGVWRLSVSSELGNSPYLQGGRHPDRLQTRLITNHKLPPSAKSSSKLGEDAVSALP
ncbi:MAG: hypothetical protein EB015_02505 [Methylocystaceae bacterium]|nr:hypothetical protein [Methylocystaceae bacterium]